MTNIIFIIALCFLAGCAAKGIPYNKMPAAKNINQSEILIYRKKQFTDGGSCYSVKIDGAEYGVLGNGGFLRKYVAPGEHEISLVHLNKKFLTIKVNSVAGASNFIEYSTNLAYISALPIGTVTSVSVGFNFAIAEVTREYAYPKIQNLRDSSVGASCISTHTH